MTTVTQELIDALAPFAQSPEQCANYSCHAGMDMQPEQCGRCGRAIAAWRAIDRARQVQEAWKHTVHTVGPLPRVPQRFLAELEAYLDRYAPTGLFLGAVLANDLVEAHHRADEEGQANLPAIVAWLRIHAPAKCWGTRERVRNWVSRYNDGIPF